MKKNDWFIIGLTAAYSYLFYEQSTGVNFLIFSILLIGYSLARNPKLIGELPWVAVASGALLSGFAVFYYGPSMAPHVNITSLILLAAFSFDTGTSIFVAFINSCFSFAVSVFSMVQNSSKRDASIDTKTIGNFKKLVLLGGSLFVVFIFFVLYRASNPLFEKVTNEIEFDLTFIGWFIFTGFGFVLLYGFFHQRVIGFLTIYDKRNRDELAPVTEEEHDRSIIATFIALRSELFAGTAMLTLLNILLLSVNSIDIYYLYILQQLPADLSLSEYLHDGTEALIFSNFLVIGIFLFFFRGRLNFMEDNKWMKPLAYGWLLQNILLIFTTASRNYFYISEYGLTHSRIGVYFFLGLCVVGLVTALIKIYLTKSNWFMFRKNSWAWYATLVLASLINWEAMIAGYNINLAIEQNKEPDNEFLGELDYPALPVLYNRYIAEKNNSAGLKTISPHLFMQMNNRYANLVTDIDSTDWQSTSLLKIQTRNEVAALISKP